MDRSERIRVVEEAESRSLRLRQRFGLTSGSQAENDIRDWMTTRGAVPVTVACAALAVYLVLTVIASWT